MTTESLNEIREYINRFDSEEELKESLFRDGLISNTDVSILLMFKTDKGEKISTIEYKKRPGQSKLKPDNNNEAKAKAAKRLQRIVENLNVGCN